jgi:hypothetical protein
MIIHSGVPQGSVLSPSLYNFFVSDFPLQAPLSHSFVDIIYVGRSSPDLSILAAKLNKDMHQVEVWADSKDLTIAPEKSSITLFTTDPHQAKFHPQAFYKGQDIPLDRNPRWLGPIQDGRITGSYHASDLKFRLSHRHRIVKALSGTPWGQSKETLLLTYKTLMRSVMDYGCAIYYPNMSDTSIKILQVVQNSVLRTVTGCHMKSPIPFLHSECNELMVKDHLELLTWQVPCALLTLPTPSSPLLKVQGA